MPPRANNLTLLPAEYVDKTKAMLDEFGETSLSNFATFWDIKYNETIDFVSLNYDGGLFQFLEDNEYSFRLREIDNFWYVSNRGPSSSSGSCDSAKENNPFSRLDRFKAKIRPQTGPQIFDKEVFFWSGSSLRYLDQEREYVIPRSAYEHAIATNKSQAQKIINSIRQVLSKFPNGILLSEIYKEIPQADVLKVFNISTSWSSLVEELPELFYRTYSQQPGGDPKVFDGFNHTIKDLTGEEDTYFDATREDPSTIATWAINEGVYQKTLLLIRQAGISTGLKINVWRKAMKLNFFPNEEQFDKNVQIQSRSFFLALARYGLVELRSRDEIKNDLLAFLPLKRIQYMQLKAELKDLLNHNDIDSDSDSD